MSETAQDQEYQVVVNDEEQYSIWEARRALPEGWHAQGFRGSRQQCLTHIAEVWTDLRPLSARAGAAAATTGEATR
ncbi:MbtH family protein [Streptomyces sp. NPDC058739]|uniref:MbtH family protein n=1 Tax=Streptomyces sp. NPDC058739 TaxID=3346618 RepID=UPI003681081A